MKKIQILFSLISCFLVFNDGFTQLKVTNQGKVGIGTYNPVQKFEVWENGLAEMRLWVTPQASYNGISRYWAVNFLGAYGLGIDQDGIGHIYNNLNSPNYFVSFSGSNTILGNPTSSGNLLPFVNNGGTIGQYSRRWLSVYSSNLYSINNYSISDERYKTNVKKLSGLTYLRQLNGVSYDFNDWAKKNYMKGDTSLIRGDNFGFLAQDVYKILPNLIVKSDDSLATMYINYNGFIPILVESVKELDSELAFKNQEIDMMNSQIQELSYRLSKFEEKCSCNQNEDIDQINSGGDISRPRLFQNEPNPFNRQTSIAFVLPDNYKSAYIYVYDLQGKLIRSFDVFGNKSSKITIDGNDLQAGVYYYSLYVNNSEVDTKKMIISNSN